MQQLAHAGSKLLRAAIGVHECVRTGAMQQLGHADLMQLLAHAYAAYARKILVGL